MRSAREVGGPLIEEISEELAGQWESMIEDAEQDIHEVRLRMRWPGPQLEVIKQAAFRQALADLPKVKTRTAR